MAYLIFVLVWVFLGLLATGILRRIDGKQRRGDICMFIILSPIFIFIAIDRFFESYDWWDKKI
jgi:hypothetical protein